MVTPAVMFIAAALKRDIILKGVSIPNFLKENPKIKEFPAKDIQYIIGQGKKLLLAIQRRNKDAKKESNGKVKK